MKQKLFQILMFIIASGCVASCKKEAADLTNGNAIQLPASAQNNDLLQSLTTPTLTPRLVCIKNASTPTDSIVYDAHRRVVKTFTIALPYGLPLTTVYTYGSGTISIKRFNSAFPASLEFDFKGTLDSKGRIVLLEGKAKDEEQEGSDKYVPMTYTFAYDSNGRLAWWKRKTETNSPHIRTALMIWSNNNIASTYLYHGSTLTSTTQYSYSMQPDNRGVWNVVKDEASSLRDFWVSDLLGLRPKNLCTKAFATWQNATGTHTSTQSWTVQNGLPVASTLNDPDISNRPIYLKYTFQ